MSIGRATVRLTPPFAHAESWDVRLFRWFGNTLGVLVVGYLALDRGFAHYHLPKTPAFVGELTLTLGAVAIVFGTKWLRQALARDAILAVLVAYMAWGLLRTLPNMHIFGVQVTVRDAALWYYAGFGIAFVAAATAVPELPQRLLRGFQRVVPWLTLWLPTALLLQRSGIMGPRFRYSNVPLFSHKPGNICCAAVICLAFLLLVPQGNGDERPAGDHPPLLERRFGPVANAGLIAINVFTMLLAATQTRGGALAETAGVVVILVLIEKRRRSRIIIGFVAGLFLVIGIGLTTNATYHTAHRSISVSQLFENAQSLEGPDSSVQLSGSVNFRFDLWGTILHKQAETSHLVNGFGFGPNLAQTGGLVQKKTQSPATQQLRSAHNSLLDIIARTGIIGASLFLIVWVGWFRRMARTLHRSRDDQETRGVIGVCVAGSLAIFVNCFFDPTLEGAQVATVLFTLFGFGIVFARTAAGRQASHAVLDRFRPALPRRTIGADRIGSTD